MQIDSYYFTYDSLLLTYKTPCICHMYITTRRVPLRCSGRTPGESLQSEMPIKVVFGIFRKNVDFAYFNTRIAKLWQCVTKFAFLCIIFWICLNSFLMFLGSIPTDHLQKELGSWLLSALVFRLGSYTKHHTLSKYIGRHYSLWRWLSSSSKDF